MLPETNGDIPPPAAQAVPQDFAITLDVDWAPDCAIDAVASLLVEHRTKATWFITHASPAVERLRAHGGLFELGVHPNFHEGSTHGTNPADVLNHVMTLVPDATSVRTHGLVQSTRLFGLMLERTPLRNDVSLLLSYAPGLRSAPLRVGRGEMRRIPFFWEDDLEVDRTDARWHVDWVDCHDPGLKVFAFHPLAVYINWCCSAQLDGIRRASPNFSAASPEGVEAFVNRAGDGARTTFDALLAWSDAGARSRTIRELP